jgi:hypothetical protein
MSPVHMAEPMRALCAQVGFDLDSVKPSVIERLQVLAQHSQTVLDSTRMIARAWDIFRYYEQAKPAEVFTALERRIVVLGCLFSDIGKTGPVGASVDGQALIAEMFSVEGVREETQSVGQFFITYFPADAVERTRRFEALGLEPTLTMRQFWNLHSVWTLEITEAGGLPPEVIAAAATHHLLDNVNPGAIVAEDRRFTRSFGDNASFDRAEKLIILLDKYDALLRRSRHTHEAAILWLRTRVDQNPQFRGDAELSTLISDLDHALRVCPVAG